MINIIAKDEIHKSFKKHFEKLEEKKHEISFGDTIINLIEASWMPENSFMMIGDSQVILVKDNKVYESKVVPFIPGDWVQKNTEFIGKEEDFTIEDYIDRLRRNILGFSRVIKPNRNPLRGGRS